MIRSKLLTRLTTWRSARRLVTWYFIPLVRWVLETTLLGSDFQEAGSNSTPVLVGDNNDWMGTAKDLMEKAYSKSNVGLGLLIFILVMIGYIFSEMGAKTTPLS